MSVSTSLRASTGAVLRLNLVALALLALAFGAIGIRYVPVDLSLAASSTISPPPLTAAPSAATSASLSASRGVEFLLTAVRSAPRGAVSLHRTALNTDQLLTDAGEPDAGVDNGRSRTVLAGRVDLPELESSWSSRGPPRRG